eukprot:1752830-Alexandrium_andersonii.AAC.1
MRSGCSRYVVRLLGFIERACRLNTRSFGSVIGLYLFQTSVAIIMRSSVQRGENNPAAIAADAAASAGDA